MNLNNSAKYFTACFITLLAIASTSCSKQSTVTNPSTSSASVASITNGSPNQQNQSNSEKHALIVNDNDPLTQLLAVTLDNGFLLAVVKNQNLSQAEKKCLVNFDNKQSLEQAKTLLSNKLTASEFQEANAFYHLPVGQKVLAFNQQLNQQLKQGHTKPSPFDVTNDEKLQISAFVQTATGQKIQQIATHDLQMTFSPIAQQILTKCHVSSEKFNAVPNNVSSSVSSSTSSTVNTVQKR